jgi:hypothetical protein
VGTDGGGVIRINLTMKERERKGQNLEWKLPRLMARPHLQQDEVMSYWKIWPQNLTPAQSLALENVVLHKQNDEF